MYSTYIGAAKKSGGGAVTGVWLDLPGGLGYGRAWVLATLLYMSRTSPSCPTSAQISRRKEPNSCAGPRGPQRPWACLGLD